jgi:hypothetical protein
MMFCVLHTTSNSAYIPTYSWEAAPASRRGSLVTAVFKTEIADGIAERSALFGTSRWCSRLRLVIADVLCPLSSDPLIASPSLSAKFMILYDNAFSHKLSLNKSTQINS